MFKRIKLLREEANYTINYFSLNFKDIVNGCWTDIVIQVPLNVNCNNDNYEQ